MRRAWPILGFLASCADSAAGLSPSDGICVSAAECQAGFVCVDRRCQPAMVSGPDEVSIEVTPAVGSDYTRTQVLDLSLSQINGLLSLRLPPPAEYEVALLDGPGLDANRLTARMSIYGTPRIPGREVEITQLITDDVSRPQTFRLIEGDYAVRVSPLDPRYPAFEVDSFTVRGDGQSAIKEFRIPGHYRTLSGRVQDALTLDPVPGATVRAVASRSGLVSTTSLTGADGLYTITLPEVLDPFFEVIVEPSPTEQPTWSYRSVIRIAEDRIVDLPLERADDSVRGFAELTIVAGEGTAMKGDPIANADIEIASSTSAMGRILTKSYRLHGRTNAEGKVVVEIEGAATDELPLINANYQVTITPPNGSQYGILRHRLEQAIGPEGIVNRVQIQLRPRVLVHGLVRSASGTPLSGASIRFDSLQGILRPNTTETNAAGNFEVDLDSGRYLAIVEPIDPRAGGELLPTFAFEVTVPDRSDHPVDVNLPPGTLVAGVTQGRTEMLSKARVEVFIQANGRTVSVARATTDAAGGFTVVLAEDTSP